MKNRFHETGHNCRYFASQGCVKAAIFEYCVKKASAVAGRHMPIVNPAAIERAPLSGDGSNVLRTL
jgi:hypothetical protein